MRIAVCQIDCAVGDVARNVEAIAAWIAGAARAGCDLVVVPEMADTGYEMAAIRQHAGRWPTVNIDDDESACAAVRRAARHYAIAVICGLSEREGEGVYNAVAVVDARGELVGHYRKTHLFSYAPVCEDRHLSRGNDATLVNLGGFRVGVMVCYDLRFPEWSRLYALRGA